MADVHFQRGAHSDNKQDMMEAERLSLKVIEDYPEWYGGYEQMGGIRFLQDNFEDAIKYPKMSVERGETALAYRNLVVAYHNIRNPTLSIESMKRAYELDEKLFGDKNMMLAVAVSYAQLKKFELARNSLAVLRQHRPDITENNDFNQVAAYIKKKINKAGITNLDGRDTSTTK